MRMNRDELTRRLEDLDPVRPDELDAAADPDARDMLARILAIDPEAEDAESGAAPVPPSHRPARRRNGLLGAPVVAGAALAVVVAVALVVLLVGPSTGGGDGGSLAGALDGAAAVAAVQEPGTIGEPYTYLKTREVSVRTTDTDERSWNVYQSTTREEWVTHDGSGRLRIVAGPSQFVGSGDRAEWEGAGRPQFLALGFGGRTEDRWLDAGALRGGVESLPTDPVALAARLSEEAATEHGELSIPAATLQLIAEDLRNPVASPELRAALFRAAKRVPGITYLGEQVDPAGRTGIAVGIPGSDPAGATHSLIFDPETAEALATETLAPAGAGGVKSPTLLRATVYLESRKVEQFFEKEGMWLSGFEPSTS